MKAKINTTLNYSLNFNLKKKKKEKIKFIVFHYTGMKKEKDAINKLINKNSKVSSHYFIKKKWRNFNFGTRFIYSLACWNFSMEKL